MASIFTQIIQREIPAHIIAENDHFIAFLDRYPLAMGHTLIVPKVEIDYLFDLPIQELQEALVFARPVAAGLQQVVTCVRVGVAVLGLEVPHAHIHLVPLQGPCDINFDKKRLQPTDEALATLAQQLKMAVK